MRLFLHWISVLCAPSCWVQNHPYSPAWDREATRLLALNTPMTRTTQCKASWGPYEIWICNHPYASIHPCEIQIRASRATVLAIGDRYREVFNDQQFRELEVQALIAGKMA